MASPSAATAVQDPSTHASRNSSQPQQETRVLTKHNLSQAQKATRSLQQASTHAKAEELAKDLDILITRHNAELEKFATDHDTKFEYIKKLTSQSSHYKKKRAVTSENAKLHLKSYEVNSGMHT